MSKTRRSSCNDFAVDKKEAMEVFKRLQLSPQQEAVEELALEYLKHPDIPEALVIEASYNGTDEGHQAHIQPNFTGSDCPRISIYKQNRRAGQEEMAKKAWNVRQLRHTSSSFHLAARAKPSGKVYFWRNPKGLKRKSQLSLASSRKQAATFHLCRRGLLNTDTWRCPGISLPSLRKWLVLYKNPERFVGIKKWSDTSSGYNLFYLDAAAAAGISSEDVAYKVNP